MSLRSEVAAELTGVGGRNVCILILGLGAPVIDSVG